MVNKRRDMNPNNKNNWKLVCSLCAADIHNTETIDLADGHFQKEHPGEGINFNLVWIGIGSHPPNRKRKNENN